MDVKRFFLSYYKNAAEDFYISYIDDPQEALKLHSHDYYQIYYICSGQLIHHLEHGSTPLYAGDVFVLPPDIPHYIENTVNGVKFYSISFTQRYFLPEKESNRLLLDFLLYLKIQPWKNIQPKITLSYSDAAFAEAVIIRIKEEFDEKKTGSDEMIRECLSSLLSLFARVYFEKSTDLATTANNKQTVMQCIKYMNTHFNDDITLAEMVQLSAMSKTNFCAVFKEITGTTFKDHLNRLRIEKAVSLIKKGETVSNAAVCCGYEDFSTFYRNFKKYKGVSPRRFYGK